MVCHKSMTLPLLITNSIIMYIIGIKFGYKETAASFCNTDAVTGVVELLHILDSQTPESCKVDTAVCRNEKNGDWQFAKDIRDYALPDFNQHFIAPMNEITPKNKEAFAAFVKLVFEYILENQSFLQYNPKTGERNFELYVSCPSMWCKKNSNQKQEYKKFISGIIPVDFIVEESKAAYFKFKAESQFPESSVLVIDVGSERVDFTAYDGYGKLTLCEGNKHGASAIEELIYKYFEEHDEDFNNAKREAEEKCTANKLNWRNAVVHYVKKQKEDFYTLENDDLTLDLSNVCICNVKGRVFDGNMLSKEQLEDEILSPYRQTLLQDLNDEKLRLEKEQIGVPKVVVLTGGASRMPWLQKLVKDVFTESEVYRDTEPSYVVSVGLAYYGLAIHESKIDSAINNLKTSIATAFHQFNKQGFSPMFTDYVLAKMQDFLIDEHMGDYAKEEPKELIQLTKF